MTINADVQKLEPGALVVMYELDATSIGGGILRFHANPHDGSLFWQGQEYGLWPIHAEGFACTSDQQPQPKLSVGNVDGSISILCLSYEDLVGAKLTRIRTFAKYLDAVNFPEGNITADPTQEFPPEVWFIERKSGENDESVEFELSSALDFQGVKLPPPAPRMPIVNGCTGRFMWSRPNCCSMWEYRRHRHHRNRCEGADAECRLGLRR